MYAFANTLYAYARMHILRIVKSERLLVNYTKLNYALCKILFYCEV